MANTSAYDLLKNKVDSANAVWQHKKDELSALITARASDVNYQYYATRIATIDGVANANNGVALSTGSGNNAQYFDRYQVWIMSTGGMYHDGTSATDNTNARSYVKGKDNTIAAKQTEVDNAKIEYENAVKALEKYEATSPVAAATVAAATAASNTKTVLIIAGVVLFLGTVTAIIYFANKKSKGAAPAAAAA